MQFFRSMFICLAFATFCFGQLTISLPQRDVGVSLKDGAVVFNNGEGYTQPGEPKLPRYTVTVVLPAGTDRSHVTVSVANPVFEDVAGTWDIRPMEPFMAKNQIVWPSGKTIVDGKDIGVYTTNAYFPSSCKGCVSVGAMRQYNMAGIIVYPFAYNPVTKKLKKLVSGSLVVTGPGISAQSVSGVKAASQGAAKPGSRGDFLKNKAVNPGMMDQYPAAGGAVSPLKALGSAQPMDAGSSVGYAIITTQATVAASKALDLYIQSLTRDQSFNVILATEAQWNNGQSIAATTTNQRADNIRAWLHANYLSMNILYVLLIGNPCPVNGDVPMKHCWPRTDALGEPKDLNDKDAPTDYYYAELNGDWSNDQGYYGDYRDLSRPGGPEQYPDVAVGRIPLCTGSSIQDISYLDNILVRVMRYKMEADKEWRKSALLSMVSVWESAAGGGDTWRTGERIKRDAVDPSVFSFYRIYDDFNPYPQGSPGAPVPAVHTIEPPVEDFNCTENKMANAWNSQNPGVVMWYTHGSSTEAANVLSTNTVFRLNDLHPSFVFSGSCTNAAPENINLAADLLYAQSVAVVASTRTCFIGSDGEPSLLCPGIGNSYLQGIITWGTRAGDALNQAKTLAPVQNSYEWMDVLQISLYGPPEVDLGLNYSVRYLSDSWYPDYYPTQETNGWGPVEYNMSNGGGAAADGQLISLAGAQYQKGIGTFANSTVTYTLGAGLFSRFRVNFGIDDILNNYCTESFGNVIFKILVNGSEVYKSTTPMTLDNGMRQQVLDVSKASTITLNAEDPAGVRDCGDFVSWGGAQLTPIPQNSFVPLVEAGKDTTVYITDGVDLHGIAVDDNLPSALTTSWRKSVGPGTATFSDVFTINAHVNFDATGTYTLALLASDGASTPSDYVTITVNPEVKPIAPTSLSATALSGNEVSLSWSMTESRQTGYKIERIGGVDASFRVIKTIDDKKTLNYTDTSKLSANTSYQYRVCAFNTAGNSPYSNTVSTKTLLTPAVPYDLQATVVSSSRVDLSWKNVATNATNIFIEKSSDYMNNFTEAAMLAASATSCSVTGLLDGTCYYFRAYTKNNYGTSPYTTEYASATTPLLAPSNLVATAVSNTEIDLSWKNNTAATGPGVQIMRAEGSSTSFDPVIQVWDPSQTTYQDKGVSPGVSYTYYVYTMVNGLYSGYSNNATASTQAYTITATAGTGGTISPSGTITVYKWQNKSFAIAANPGFTIDAVTVDGVSQGAVASYQFTNVTANHTINATFKVNVGLTKQTVSAVSASSAVQVASLAIDGKTTTRWESTQNVDPQWIRFDMGSSKAITVMVLDWETASAKNYTIEGSNDATFATKTTLVTKTNMPSVQHRIDSLTGLTGSYRYYRMYGTARSTTQWGYSIWEARLYTGSGSTTYKLTTTTSGNGSGTIALNPAGGVYSPNQQVAVSATPAASSNFTGWSGAASGTITPVNVVMDADKTVTATFTLKTFTITVTVGPNGSVSPNGTVTVNYNSTPTFTITPISGYQVDAVTVDNVSQGTIASYTFLPVTANHSINATFKVKTTTTNLALNKTSYASSFQVNNEIAKANDADASGTRWAASSATLPQWWMVDLCSGETPRVTKTVNSFTVVWYKFSATYTYKVEVSLDNNTWTKVGDFTDATTATNRTMTHTLATGVAAQYVRISISGVSNGWASMFDFAVTGQ